MLCASVPKRNHLLVETSSAGAVGIGRHWDAFMETMLSRPDALLIHLVQYGRAMEFEYTEQGEVYMVVIPGMSPLSVHTAIPTRWLSCH